MSKYRARCTRLKEHLLPPQQQTDQHKLKQYQKRFIKEVKSNLESDHLNPVNELKSTTITSSEFQAFITRSLKYTNVLRFLNENGQVT